MLVVHLAVIANNLHSANHGADGEKTKDFGTDNSQSSHLLSVDIADGVEDIDGVVGAESGEDGRGVAERVRKWCEVGLELGDRAVRC
jgi:hypothetical protein